MRRAAALPSSSTNSATSASTAISSKAAATKPVRRRTSSNWPMAVCCTVADEFVPALDAILAKGGIEHIVIETSGLALPKPLVQAFHWPAIKSRVTVDGVVVVVDGAALAGQWNAWTRGLG